jgi:cell fate (sporulation/competence/biofilm development) regulator YmcA (YheA/YmcA/DUF963 family)
MSAQALRLVAREAPTAHAATSLVPFRTTLSLEPLIAYWQEREQDANAGISMLARAIGKQVQGARGAAGPCSTTTSSTATAT